MSALKRTPEHKRPKWLEDAAKSNRLRVAAPDLLVALQNILGMAEAHVNRCKALRHNKGKPVIEAMEADIAAARAAIAKAEGHD